MTSQGPDSLNNPGEGSHPYRSPKEVYQATAASRGAEADALERTARRVEVARLLTFVVGVLGVVLYDEVPAPEAVGLSVALLGFAAFAVLVVRHRTLRLGLRRARVGAALARLGILRLERDWDGLAAEMESIGYVDPLLEPDAVDEAHPYARDLDVFGPASVRALLGPTPTPTGTGTLRRWLLEPASPDEIEGRQTAVRALARDAAGRERLAGEALMIDRVDHARWRAFLDWASGPSIFGPGNAEGEPGVPAWAVPVARLAPLVTIGLFVRWFVTPGASVVVWLLPLAVQGTLALRWGRAFGAWFGRAGSRAPGLRHHHGLFAAWEALDVDDAGVRALQARLRDEDGLRASEEIRALERWLDLAGSQGSMVHEIVAVLFLWDVHVAVGLDRWRRRAGPSIERWFAALGELEALSALATLAGDHPEWSFPRLLSGEPRFEATALGHPLLPDQVRRTSDVRLDPPGRFLLVTGSNMSGKSTLLRSIGLAAVMGQAGSVVCAADAGLGSLRTFTSMRIHDSITGGVSLFMAELLRLKALVDAADEDDGRALLYLVDEVLQGTNSEERRVAAQRIIRHLLGARAIGAVTTHDLALHEEELLDRASTKVHFREHVDDSGGEVLTFDYVLRPGLATSRNALRLLRLVGLGGDEE